MVYFNRDTYSYVWPRDGALVAYALDQAGHPTAARNFFRFISGLLQPEGCLLHKFNPDGTLASSWHPWYHEGQAQLPIQEDSTALVVWALWQHFVLYRDLDFIKPLYRPLVKKTADFMCQYRDAETGLPAPSYDLWEERRGILSFTVGTVFGGLTAASLFCQVFGEDEKAAYYQKVAAEIRDAASAHLWRPELGRFCRMIHRNHGGPWEVDGALDASLWGLFAFGLYNADDPRLAATMTALREKLWVNTPIGGLARYENDDYHRVSREVPGNPWFICTLWLADYLVEKNGSDDELSQAMDLVSWVAAHALPSGVLPEQINPLTGESISVSPLTWSHGTYIATAHRLLRRLAAKRRQPGRPPRLTSGRETGSNGSMPRPATPSTASASFSRTDCRLSGALLLQLLETTPKSRRVRGFYALANLFALSHGDILVVGVLVPHIQDVGSLIRIGVINLAVALKGSDLPTGQGVQERLGLGGFHIRLIRCKSGLGQHVFVDHDCVKGLPPRSKLPSAATPAKQDCHQDKTDSRLRSGLPPVRHHALLLMQFFFNLGLRRRHRACHLLSRLAIDGQLL